MGAGGQIVVKNETIILKNIDPYKLKIEKFGWNENSKTAEIVLYDDFLENQKKMIDFIRKIETSDYVVILEEIPSKLDEQAVKKLCEKVNIDSIRQWKYNNFNVFSILDVEIYYDDDPRFLFLTQSSSLYDLFKSVINMAEKIKQANEKEKKKIEELIENDEIIDVNENIINACKNKKSEILKDIARKLYDDKLNDAQT
ncbi:MAG: hypothetical protein Q6363_009440 [Candidatus Njordarchaeota archaeon]